MLNTTKLLYILPDISYSIELLPDKKEHEFSVSAFKQVNGKFLENDKFILPNLSKLFAKLENQEFHLVLPDFLFTNTIVTVDETDKQKALTHVKENLLPSLNITKETHEIRIAVLTSFNNQSKVQISAIEKTVLAPITTAIQKTKTKIKAISPLSWTVKAVVSLEPSITVFQLGNNLYSALQYIGVDQTNNFAVEKLDSIVETIKTLKGAESSIQTVYLSSNSLIEQQLKESLGTVLPVQQLATYKEDDSKMPSYIKYTVEACAKTLSIPDFPVPNFELSKINSNNKESTTMEELKKPQAPTATSDDQDIKDDKKEETKEVKDAEITKPTPIETVEVKEKEEETITPSDTKKETTSSVTKAEVVVETPKDPEIKKESLEITTKDNETKKEDKLPEISLEDTKTEAKEVNLSQFANPIKEETATPLDTKKETTPGVTKAEVKTTTKKVIKNSSGVNNMLKMVFITLAVFFITIAIGIGVGLGLLKMSDKKEVGEVVPEVVVEPTATPEPTLEPEEEVSKDESSILVVNATTKAGYAGKIKTLLTDDEWTDITAGNAKGEYEDTSDYILMVKENKALQSAIEKSLDMELEYNEKIEVEDKSEKYDVVIVLAK